MNYFKESVREQENGARLVDSSSNLYKAASKSESIPEILNLTLQALNKDLEAISLFWEATVRYKETVEKLREEWETDRQVFETEVLDINP